MGSYSICNFVTGLFHLAKWLPLCPHMLQQVSRFLFLLKFLHAFELDGHLSTSEQGWFMCTVKATSQPPWFSISSWHRLESRFANYIIGKRRNHYRFGAEGNKAKFTWIKLWLRFFSLCNILEARRGPATGTHSCPLGVISGAAEGCLGLSTSLLYK
jgi:hypothetical protein